MLPNSPQDIVDLVMANITVAISTDGLLPLHPEAHWISAKDAELLGPETLMMIAHPAMKLLHSAGYNENAVLALITLNPAIIMGKEDQYGSLREGLDANFIVSSGIPGLEITNPEEIQQVYYQGIKVIDRN